MDIRNAHTNRRELLRNLAAGAAVATAVTMDTGVGSGQVVANPRPLAEKLLASKYLPELYSRASAALLEFDNLTAAGNSAGARKALTNAAALICEALTRLESDSQFWATLDEQKKLIGQNAAEIKRLENNLDEFVLAEEKALQPYMEAGPRTRLVSGLSVALSRFRLEPTNWTREDLRNRVAESRDAVCKAAKPPVDQSRGGFFADIRIAGYGLGVLGGAAGVVINVITAMALPLALASIVSGLASIIGSSAAIGTEVNLRKA